MESEAAFPSASTAETCVVPPAGDGLGPAGEATVDAPPGGAELGRREQPRREAAAMEAA